MRVALPTTLDEAVEALQDTPDAHLLAGGTDFCVEVNFGLRRPPAVVALRRVAELRMWQVQGDRIVIGAGTTYADMLEHLREEVPALAAAARTVGSPQIRNAGTLGGNIATASPAGDTLPVLVALDAQVTLRGPSGVRSIALRDLVVGVKRTAIEPGEVVTAVSFERPGGSQQFLKVGTRNAMVIAIASVAVVLDVGRRQVRCALGSVAPVPLRAVAAERHAVEELDWSRLAERRASGTRVSPGASSGRQAAEGRDAPFMTDSAIGRFGELCALGCAPITDHRSTAEYRRRAVEVIAARALRRCLHDIA